METLIETQSVIYNRILNHYENFKKKAQARMTCDLANTRIQRLKGLLEEFISNDKAIHACDDLDLSHKYFSEEFFYQAEEAYDEVMDQYVQFLKTHAPAPVVVPTPPAPPTQPLHVQDGIFNLSSMLRSLPQLTLPEFSGNSADWPQFRDMFTSLVHTQQYPPVVKLTYLHKLLKDEALAVIRSIPISEGSYDTAWDTLKLFYENERRLVNNHLADLFSVKPMTIDSYAEAKRLMSETFAPLDALTTLKRPTKYWSDVIVFLIVRNMDKDTRRDWEKSLGRSSQPPTLERVKSFLEAQALIYESVERATKPAEVSSKLNKKSSSNTSLQASVESSSKKDRKERDKNPSKCSFCKNDHYISKCPKFQAKPQPDRKAFITKAKLCVNCLGAHNLNACRSKHTCFTCKGKHHTLLHYVKENLATNSVLPQQMANEPLPNVPPVPVVENRNEQVANVASFNGTTLNYGQRTGVVLATARIIVEGPNGRKIKARALIDNCSQPSFISQNLFQELRLPSTSTNTPVSSVGGVQAVVGTEITKFVIRPHFSSRFSCEVKALIVPQVCKYSPPQSQFVSSLLYLSGLNLADPTFLDDSEIEILLGADIHALIIEESIIRGKPNEPIATSSQLGWLISGSIPLTSHASALSSFHVAQKDNLSELLQDFWRQEELPPTKFLTPAEEACEEHYAQNVKRDEKGRYVVKLPFKNPVDYPIGDSYQKAVSMLQRMEIKFENNPEFKQLYFDFMGDYISSGHMIPVSQDSSLYKQKHKCYFLPHHGVLKPSSTTTKLRTVFNGSSKTNLNISVNSLLHTGPNLLPELPDLISAWRLYKYVFVADIKQMFRQIRLSEDDLHYQAVVWRFNPDDPIQVYYLTTVTYGLVSSPFQATRTLRQLSMDLQSAYPLAAEIVRNECYMDDFLSGGHSLDQTLEKQSQLISILKEGGFELRKWLSNQNEIISHLPLDHLASDPSMIFETSSLFTVLGLNWSAKDDSISFKVNYKPETDLITKRSVLSKIAQIFDPLGWIAPITISAKIFMQSLWLLKCNWDDPLPPEYTERWKEWASELSCINALRIPRFVGFSPDASCCEIHGFADASQNACSAVIYLRILSNQNTCCTLQMAKTKVAPLRTLSIPRLELVGASMLANLTSHFQSSLPIKIDSVHLWSDSKDVLFWLRRHPSHWQTFVANRCSAILTTLPTAYWHYVKSSDNPADVASRGIEPGLLSCHPLWWHGPSWLLESSDPWTTSLDNLLDHNPIEQRSEKVGLLSNVCVEVPEKSMWNLGLRFSSLSRLLRVSAYVLRFVNRWTCKYNVNIRDKFFKFLDFSETSETHLTTKELHNSKLLWVYYTQRAYFSSEIKILENPQKPKRMKFSGALQKLRPTLKDGFLRVGGRLDQSLLPYDSKHPFILPGDCFFSELLIRQAHATTLHGGVQLTLGTLRQEFWLIRGRQAVKASLGKCNVCVRYSAKHSNQFMGDLPSHRVTPAPSFSRTGVDYAGPFSIRLTKSRGVGTLKGYVCLFVCLVTRGIHLEIVEDYTAESFIAAFHRFVSIWGHCTELVSDQGTNFMGADAELRRMFRQSSTFLREVHLHLAQLGTKWTWNPPGAPHFGGIWEAGVKSTKHHIRRVIGDSILTFSEMATLLRRIQACLNSRPLLPLTDEISDNNFLTPAHFLIQRKSYLIPEPDFTMENVPAGRRWQLISQRAQNFWSRWRNEYLSSLQPRCKWTKETRSFQPGDVVYIRQESTPPGHWPLAKVVRTFPDRHGINRVCELETAFTKLKRPSVKLVLLLPVEKEPQPPINLELPSSNIVLLQAAE